MLNSVDDVIISVSKKITINNTSKNELVNIPFGKFHKKGQDTWIQEIIKEWL